MVECKENTLYGISWYQYYSLFINWKVVLVVVEKIKISWQLLVMVFFYLQWLKKKN